MRIISICHRPFIRFADQAINQRPDPEHRLYNYFDTCVQFSSLDFHASLYFVSCYMDKNYLVIASGHTMNEEML
jgi:hypothetical protein